MNAEFWHQKWEKNEIGFHERKPNPLLVTYFNELNLIKGSRVFLPLCGKTLDIAWLLSRGFQVVGAELSRIAIEQLFKDLDVEPVISKLGDITHYSEKNINIFVGDIFELSSDTIGSIDAIYDRAALVALPEKIRNKYAMHLLSLTNTAPQLLITFEYDQSVMSGPPFSLNSDDVNRYYRNAYNLKCIESRPVQGGLKNKCAVTEHVWLLKNDLLV